MSVIDIKKSYRHVSPEELRSAAYSGIVYCGSSDLSDFLEYIFQDMYGEQDLKEVFEAGKKEALENEISFCSECEAELN